MEYILANPTGNITVLVTTDVPEAERLSVVQELFSQEPSCEQVGFVDVTGEKSIKLEMMGGEFCGNATLSAAAYCAKANRLFGASDASSEGEQGEALSEEDAELTITVDSSGTDKPVPVALRCLDVERGEYEGTLKMPMPQLERAEDAGTCESGYAVVHLDGISHMIVPAEAMSHEEAEAAIKRCAEQVDALAFGILLYSENDGDDANMNSDNPDKSCGSVRIEPLVFVKGSGTMVWEHGCASGSIAAAYYKHSISGVDRVSVNNPGGVITIDITGDKLYLTGKVYL